MTRNKYHNHRHTSLINKTIHLGYDLFAIPFLNLKKVESNNGKFIKTKLFNLLISSTKYFISPINCYYSAKKYLPREQ